MPRKPKIVLDNGIGSPMAYAAEVQRRATPDMVDQAVRADKCMLAFQPIVPASNPSVPAYYEGLIRIFDEGGRVIPARDFIHDVENTETGRLIDVKSLAKTAKTLREVPTLILAVNTSARSIGYAPWTNRLYKIVNREPEIAKRMVIEISEKSVMQLPEIVSRFINDLEPKGVQFSLDQFGAGLSSLSYLRDIPFRSVKLDGKFIRNVSETPRNQAVVNGATAMARSLGMNLIAEKVEDKADMQWLQRAGVAAMQGFLFGIPTLNPEWSSDPFETGRKSP